MVVADLLAELDRLGVRLLFKGDRLTTQARKGVMTPELMAAIKEQKPILLGVLKLATPETVPPLPEPLRRLVGAATSNQLPSHSVDLGELGRVTDFAGYVMAWAATYNAEGDTAHCLRHLRAAYAVWQPQKTVNKSVEGPFL